MHVSYGTALDVILCIITLIMLRKELTEHSKKKVEGMVESGALIVAMLVLVTVIGLERIGTLQEKRIEKEIEVAHEETAQLRSKMQPRSISPEQSEKFTSFLRNAPKGEVMIVMPINSGEESQDYANQIAKMIRSAGFNPIAVSDMSNPEIPRGIVLVASNSTNPPYAGAIQQALKAIGIDAKALQETSRYPVLKIVVGSKP